MGKNFECYWDCSYCNSKRILSKFQNCPHCNNARMDSSFFYMLEKDDFISEDLLVEEIPYWRCSCGTFNSQAVCINCGLPYSNSLKKEEIIENENVNLNEILPKEKIQKERLFVSKPLRTIFNSYFYGFKYMLLLVLALLVICILSFIPTGEKLKVHKLSWTRSIDIEMLDNGNWVYKETFTTMGDNKNPYWEHIILNDNNKERIASKKEYYTITATDKKGGKTRLYSIPYEKWICINEGDTITASISNGMILDFQ